MCRQCDGLARKFDHRHQGLQRIESQLIDVGIAADRIGPDQDRVTVRRTSRHILHADIAVGARLIFDNDLLAERE
jgi:hypothetical protein